MEYADVVIVAVVAAFPLSVSVLLALGSSPHGALLVAAVAALAVIGHALFANPPGRRDRE